MLQYSLDSDIPASTFNAGKTLHQGIEAGLLITLPGGFSLNQTYTFNDFRFVDDRQYGDNVIAGLPKHRSEEHTSELQSLMRTSSAVFCLKKQKTNQKNT